MLIAKVLIQHPVNDLDIPFDYLYLPDQKVIKGTRVLIPFNHQIIIGYVLDTFEDIRTLPQYKEANGFNLQGIIEVIDETPIINDELNQIASFISFQYASPLIASYQTMLPPSLKPIITKNIVKIKYLKYVMVCNYDIDGLSNKQTECLEYLYSLSDKGDYANNIPFDTSVLNALAKKGRIEINIKEKFRDPFDEFVIPTTPPRLNDEQAKAIQSIIDDPNRFFLLQGVTGSGKTEVYINLTKYYLQKNKNVIILVPEISLTPQMVRRFKARIEEGIAIFHSGLSAGEKYDEYRRIRQNKVRVVIGARSAIFTPLENLGLIIIDEEHSETYKQENMPSYHARDIAIFRADYHNCKLLLGSATPSLETKARALKGLYKEILLNKRISEYGMPKIMIVNMIDELRRGNYNLLSKTLSEKLIEVIEKKEQAILFLNRRGFSKQVSCKSCGHPFTCPHCEVALTFHKEENLLKCHYCDYQIPYPEYCPKCYSKYLRNSISGTQKVEEILKKNYPHLRIARMDQDTVKVKNGHKKILDAFENKEFDVLLGTQMIAKGLDFENVTLVGVINADIGLSIDFRSCERIFQLLEQVCGRAGRGSKAGVGIIQTNNPEHYAITTAANHDYQKFFQEEMKFRKEVKYPPFRYLASIMFEGRNLDRVNVIAEKVKIELLANNLSNFEILGPAQPYLKKHNDDYRMRLLIKYKDKDTVLTLLNKFRLTFKNSSIKISIDIDPYQEN